MTDFKKGGPLQNSNIFATNRLFVKNPLFKKKKKKRAPGVYNPKGKFKYEDGGSIIDLTEEEIQKYIDGGYVVEEVNDPSIPALTRAAKGGSLKRFIDGGEEDCPEGYMKNENGHCVPSVAPEQVDADEWYRNWYANRVIQDEEGQKLLNEARPKILKRAEKFPEVQYFEESGPEAGYYSPKTGNIKLNSTVVGNNPFLKNEVLFHEKGHYLTYPSLKDPEMDTYKKMLQHPIHKMKEYETDVIKNALVRKKNVPKKDREYFKYISGDYGEEISKRIMEMRRLAGFKPDQVITDKDVEDFYKKAAEKGWTNPESDKFVEPLHDLKIYTKSPEEIKNLLNKLAKNEPEQVDEFQPQSTKYGGSKNKKNISISALNRYDNGGSPKSQWIAPAEMYSGRSNVDPTTGLIYKDLGDLDVKAGKKGFKRKVQDFFRKDIGKLTKEAEELGKGIGYIAGVQGDIEPAVYNREGIKKFKSEVKRLKGDFNTELKDAEKKRKQESDNKAEYDKWKKKLDDGDISASEFLLKGKGKNWEAYNDVKVAKGSGPGADYSATDAGKEWGDSDQWNKFIGLVSNAATAIPLLGAAGAMGSASAAILENPYVQAGLTAYGVNEAVTNTLPEAYKDFSEGRYWEGLGNTALGALDFVPGVGLAGKGAKLGYKGLGKAINYAKNLEPSAPGPMMLGFNLLNKTKNLDNVDDLKLIDTEAQTLKDRIRTQIKPEDASFRNVGTAEDPVYIANTRGRSMDYDQTVGMLEEMTGKMPVLEEAGFPMYLHGSTSASLPGIIKSGGIEPLGDLINRGEVPFTGELATGVKGINQGNTSTAYIRSPESALNYALNQSGKGRINVEDDLNKWFTQKRGEYKPGAYGAEPEFYDDLYNKRLTQWQNLSKEEQSLLNENFPVMYGIKPKTATTATNGNRFTMARSDVSDEMAIAGKIGMDEIPSMFVPKSHVETVQKLLGDQSKVLPMEQFIKNQRPFMQEKMNKRWQDLGFSLEKYGGNIHKQGGATDDYIEVDIPEEEIQWYIDNGYRVEPVTKLKKFIG